MINRKLTKKTAVVFSLIFVCTCVLLITACSCSRPKKETIPESVTTFILPLDEIDNVTDRATEKENDRYLGTVSLKNIDTVNGTAEYALVVIRSAQNKGVAKAATRLVLKTAFYERGLRRVYLSVYSNNIAAIRMYEGSGFKLEGEFRKHFIIDGEYVGWKWYGILKEEFDEIV